MAGKTPIRDFGEGIDITDEFFSDFNFSKMKIEIPKKVSKKVLTN
jgi:hypothetical protein